MDALRGFTLLLLCQSAGEALARLAHWPLPGPVLGLVLLVGLLQWPAVRVPVEAAVIGHLGLVGQYGVQMLVALVLSTWVGLLVAAWVLRALLRRETAAPLAP